MQLRRHEDDTGRMRKGMYVLPSLFTTANLAAGFYAITMVVMGVLKSAPGTPDAMRVTAWHLNVAALAIGFAVLFDGMDGAIARLTNTASDFGKELDSLADVVAFGVAPAALAWAWGFLYLPPMPVSWQHLMQLLGWADDAQARLIQIGALVSLAFLTAGACRLARFNITLNPQPKNPGRPGRKYFVGMPIPGGAGCVAAVVHLRMGHPISAWWSAAVWMAYILLCAFLMVSTWRFWSSKSLDFRSRKAARLFVPIALGLGAVWYFHRYVLFALVVTYMASGVFFRLMYALRRGGKAAMPPEAK